MAEGIPFILEEDNDGSHGTRSLDNIVYKAKLALGPDFKFYANPPQSPDLSIIENVWRTLKQRIKNRKPSIKEELRQVIFEEWDKIAQEEINDLVLTMQDRVRECWLRGGLHTRY